jgi:NAD dependent epimerase/dehydratase
LAEVPGEVREAMEIVPGDVRDASLIHRAMAGADVVFHLAALIGIPWSYESPASYVQTNVQGTLNVLEAARAQGVRRVVHTSTSEVYGTARVVPISEDHPLQPQSPYAASKVGADALAQSFHASFGLPVVIARPFNTYGPRQSLRAVLPTILAQLLAGAKELNLGATSPTRDMNYISDTVAGFIACASAPPDSNGQAYNLGSGSEISIGDLARLAMKVLDLEVPIVCDAERLRPAGSEVERLLADNARARTLLGWKPAVSLEEGIAATADWMRGRVDTSQSMRYTR